VSEAAKRRRRAVAFVVGLALLGGAVAVAFSRRSDAAGAWASVHHAPASLIALALALPAMNILVTSVSFWVQMRRFGPVTLVEMTALIGVAWLLNYLPLRAGMFGRLAYHKAVHRISLKDSVSAMVVGMALGGVAVLLVLGIAATMRPDASVSAWSVALSAPILIGVLAALATARAGRWWLSAVFLSRYADMLIWVLRYWLVFRLVGEPITLPASVAVAAVSQLALNIPIAGNGLGLREWFVGLAASNLPAGMLGPTGRPEMAPALAADIVNRAAELTVAVPMGLLCAAYLAHRNKK
jgi:hypothetical protein